jgi:hypothetical protein
VNVTFAAAVAVFASASPVLMFIGPLPTVRFGRKSMKILAFVVGGDAGTPASLTITLFCLTLNTAVP